MAKRTKAEIRKLYDAYGEDKAGMDKITLEHESDIVNADKLSKKILSIICKEFGKNYEVSPLMLMTSLAKTTADMITALDIFGYDGDTLEEAFCDCLSMSRMASEDRLNPEESEG
jgi:hypothetical protein